MANEINVLTLSGRMTRDAEIRAVGDRNVAKFGFASNYYQGKNKEEGTLFLDCEAWAEKADILAKYTKKGSALVLVGQLRMDSWDDKDSGQKRTKVFLDVRELKLPPADKDTKSVKTDKVDKSEKKQESEKKGDEEFPF